MATKNNSEHFIELANKRVPKAHKYLDLVGNLANKSNYSYTEQQSQQTEKALKDKVNEICRKFDSGTNSDSSFKLK